MEFMCREKISACKRSNIVMGMKILKLKYHIAASLRLVMYKALFGGRFSVGGVLHSEGFSMFT